MIRKPLGWLLVLFLLVACQNEPVVKQETEEPVAAATLTTAPPTPLPTSPPDLTATREPAATSTPTLAPTTTAAPHPTSASAQFSDTMEGRIAAANLFTYAGDTPIIPHGPTGTWDGQFTDPGGAVYADGLFHMFHNGFVGWPAPVAIAHATSPDGYTWSRAADPVFSGDDLPYTGLTVLASSALVEPDRTWVLYFYTWDEVRWPTSTGGIGRATAPSPDGPWTADFDLVLAPGSEDEWDGMALRAPSVIRTDTGYVMFYSGHSMRQAAIGMATSPDGITWTKYDDPATTDTPYAESDPVFRGSDETAWDSGVVYQPRVQLTPDGWVMLYAANTSGATTTPPQHGIAISQDGINWTRTDAPVIDATEAGGGAIWYTELLYQDGTYFIFFELGKIGIGTEVYLATHTGSLNPEG